MSLPHRLRRGDHTPAGAREALGLSPGGSGSGLGLGALGGANGPMGRRGSRATGGTTGTTASGSSLGRESEDGGTAQGGLGRWAWEPGEQRLLALVPMSGY